MRFGYDRNIRELFHFDAANADGRTHTFTDVDIDYRGQDDDTDTGKYWVRMAVQVSGDNDTDTAYFAKQIVVQPDYVLSVNPGSVREDADATTVSVRVKTGNGVAVDADKYVLLSVSTEGLNTRFRITLPTLKIPQGGTDAEGTITFTPIPILRSKVMISLS